MHYVYILWSKRLGRYYVGETEDPIQRLRQHNEHLFKDASTAVTNDWKMLCSIMCEDRAHARRIERFIKRQKSRRTITALISDEPYRQKIIRETRA